MAVTVQTPLIGYTSAGGPDFVFPFRVDNDSHLKVFVDGTLTTSGYVLDGIGNPLGGTLSFLEPYPPAGTKIVLARQVPLARSTDYIEGGALRASVLDADFDNLVYMIQDIRADALTITEFQVLADQSRADAEAASDSADAAAASASAAASSAAAALSSENDASASAAAALDSQTAALASQTAAASSASAAASSQSSATASQTAAATSATNASNSATAAAGSASAAAGSASAAATSASNASTSASAAAGSASAAATSATAAQGFATGLARTGSAYTRADLNGKVIPVGTNQTIVVGDFIDGDIFGIENTGDTTLTLTQGSGLTMRMSGTTLTGSRTLGPRGLAVVRFTGSGTCLISGPGVA